MIGIGTAFVLLALECVKPLRMHDGDEHAGIDIAEHDEQAYSSTRYTGSAPTDAHAE